MNIILVIVSLFFRPKFSVSGNFSVFVSKKVSQNGKAESGAKVQNYPKRMAKPILKKSK
jgi:hypothetical protein